MRGDVRISVAGMRLWIGLLILGGGLTSAVRATEIPPGPVSGHWYAAGNPYNINGEIYIPSGDTLIVHPGVDVIFQGHYKFRVFPSAVLWALGTNAGSGSILFTAALPATGWHGLRFFSASPACSLKFCRLEYGKAYGPDEDANGGAIYCTSSSPKIVNCQIDSCSADNSGGALFCTLNSNPIVSACTISHNTAQFGAGLRCTNAHPTITGSLFTNNSATVWGGGISVYGSAATFSSNHFTLNEAGYGGGLHSENSVITFNDNLLEDNSADFVGGGIVCYYSNPLITGDTLRSNSAPHGGGIYCYESQPTISGNLIEQNSGEEGAGLYCENSDPVISDSNLIVGNVAENAGGGIYCHSSQPQITGNVIRDNEAGEGAGIYCLNAAPLITNNLITHNTGVNLGGGIHCSFNSTAQISNNTISLNTSHYGAGIYSSHSDLLICDNTIVQNSTLDDTMSGGGGICGTNFAFLTITNNTIRNNASDLGGGIYLDSADATIQANTLDSNYATFLGGAISCHFATNSLIDSNLIRFNLVDSGGRGGGIFCNYSDPLIEGNLITQNTCYGEGGGLRLYYSDALIRGNTISYNSANYGVGIYCETSNAVIENNFISSNVASQSGGGIYCFNEANGIISNNTLTANNARYGAGLFLNRAHPEIVSNVINANVASGVADAAGAGIYCDSADPNIHLNSITYNEAQLGGGLFCDYSHPIVFANTITDNLAASTGGGIYCQYTNALIDSNSINHNTADYGGGVFFGNLSDSLFTRNTLLYNTAGLIGGGMLIHNADPHILNNTISHNNANFNGGGIHCYENADPTIQGNTVTQNTASSSGGGIFCVSQAQPVILQNLICQNQAVSAHGGGLCLNASVNLDTVFNNTLYGNLAGGLGGGLYLTGSTAIVKNAIVWGNTAAAGLQIYVNSGASVVVSYSDVQGGWPGTGNLNANPLFVDPANGDFHECSLVGSYHNGQWLPDSVHSPCIDAGDPNFSYENEPVPNGLRLNMGAYGNTEEASKSRAMYLSGPVSGIWTAAFSPYILVDSVWVPANSSLVIQAGVQVTAQGHYKFKILSGATLKALGTAQSPILFTADNPATGWQGLRFLSASDSCRLQHCHITYGQATGTRSTDRLGGALYLNNTDLIADSCVIDSCLADSGGAIYCGNGSTALISGCTMVANTALYKGGAIFCQESHPTLTNNLITRNSANLGGGIYSTGGSHPILDLNEISENHALAGNGGGLYADGYIATDSLNKNTFYGNTASNTGGGLYHVNSNLAIKNGIFWGNTAPAGPQIWPGPSPSIIVQYSDVQGGYTGTGNLSTYPVFVDTATNNFHLLGTSPCIDVGDPSTVYNDPDGTRADLGRYYYPHYTHVFLSANLPIQIPVTGGSFNYLIGVENVGYTVTGSVWVMVKLPNGQPYGPVVGPVSLNMSPTFYVTRNRVQFVPGSAPPGNYLYLAYVGVYPNTIWNSDTLAFTKLTTGNGPYVNDWSCSGEDFDLWLAQEQEVIPESYDLEQNYPNPFNPSTVVRYQIPEARYVSLRVYDISGRLVTTLVDGWREAGTHELTFNAEGLPSGVYFCRLLAGDFSASSKMVLLK